MGKLIILLSISFCVSKKKYKELSKQYKNISVEVFQSKNPNIHPELTLNGKPKELN